VVKKRKGVKKNKGQRRIKKLVLNAETKKGILTVIFFVLAVISLLSFFGQAGIFGNYFLKFSQLLFGQAIFVIPVSFALLGTAVLTFRLGPSGESGGKEKSPHYGTIFWGVVLFIFSVLGIFYAFGAEFNGEAGLAAGGRSGGGYLGLAAGYPLMKFLGFWAGLVVLASLLVISILITFNLSLLSPFRKKDEKEQQPPLFADKMGRGKVGMAGAKEGIWQKFKDKTREEIDKRKFAGGQKDDREGTSEAILTGGRGKKPAEADFSISSAPGKSKSEFQLPSLDFLEKDKGQPTSGDIKANINIIKRTLGNFGIEVEMAEVNVGPTVTQYTLRPAQGMKLSRITALQNDLALALAAHPLRIEAPIPGRSLAGIEIPNRSAVIVRLRPLLENSSFREDGMLNLALGRDVAGNPVYADLARMPHMLVAGATGTGKTIALNNIILSLLYRGTPDNLKFILIDPKRVELTSYDSIPHLLTPAITQPEKAVGALRWAVSEMERRFGVLQEAGKRDIASLNKKCSEKEGGQPLPYIIIVIDELADLMSSYGREAEASIVRLAQMARAVGIHLIVSTQRPSVEIITGLIKANITCRMAFQVASQIDSRTVLDMAGAEKLLGRGDMLFLAGNSAKPRRLQGAFISDKEVKKVVDYLKETKGPDYKEEIISSQKTLRPEIGFGLGQTALAETDDELYLEAKEVVARAGKASASLLQRRLRVGYARAARLLDILEEKGIVGPADGAKPRDVYIDEGEDRPIE